MIVALFAVLLVFAVIAAPQHSRLVVIDGETLWIDTAPRVDASDPPTAPPCDAACNRPDIRERK
jgi:hypothetical protein